MIRLKYPVILASSSPRRKELLEMLEIPFTVQTLEVEENIPDHISPKESALFLAKIKADAHQHLVKNQLIITADTVVVANNIVLGKPTNTQEASDMLITLSNSTHEVITGVIIRVNKEEYALNVSTKVTFSALTSNEINHYVQSDKANDKAGAYGIQDWIGLIGISSIEGSYYNVMGFPTFEVYECLKKHFAI